MTLPHPSLGIAEAFALEFVITCALITIICGVWDPRNRNNADSGPLREFEKAFAASRYFLSSSFRGRFRSRSYKHRWRAIYRSFDESCQVNSKRPWSTASILSHFLQIFRASILERTLGPPLDVLDCSDDCQCSCHVLLQNSFLEETSWLYASGSTPLISYAKNWTVITLINFNKANLSVNSCLCGSCL